jgi:hypothetical protein
MHTWCATHDDLVVEPQNHLALRMIGFHRVGPQNSAVAIPTRIIGGMWRHHEGCVEAKQLHEECMLVR